LLDATVGTPGDSQEAPEKSYGSDVSERDDSGVDGYCQGHPTDSSVVDLFRIVGGERILVIFALASPR
jgi:hypothetical protein